MNPYYSQPIQYRFNIFCTPAGQLVAINEYQSPSFDLKYICTEVSTCLNSALNQYLLRQQVNIPQAGQNRAVITRILVQSEVEVVHYIAGQNEHGAQNVTMEYKSCTYLERFETSHNQKRGQYVADTCSNR